MDSMVKGLPPWRQGVKP